MYYHLILQKSKWSIEKHLVCKGGNKIKHLDINFDVIDKTYEARGQHNVRRWFRVNKLYDVVGSIIPATHLVMALSGTEPPEEALIRSMISIGTNFGLWATLDTAIASIKAKVTGLNYKERACIELIILSQILSENGINISVNQMMEAEVYHKKYKLSKEGTPGIIRERYFEANMTDQLGDEKPTSIKEEHLLGSRKYRLSFDKPAEQRQYKLAYNI